MEWKIKNMDKEKKIHRLPFPIAFFRNVRILILDRPDEGALEMRVWGAPLGKVVDLMTPEGLQKVAVSDGYLLRLMVNAMLATTMQMMGHHLNCQDAKDKDGGKCIVYQTASLINNALNDIGKQISQRKEALREPASVEVSAGAPSG